MPSSSRLYLRLLIIAMVLAVLGGSGWWAYQEYGDRSKKQEVAADTVTPKVTEAYKKSLDAGLRYIVLTDEKQAVEDGTLDGAADTLSSLVGQKYGLGRQDQFKSIFRVHYDIASKYYQALAERNDKESEKQLLSLKLWVDQISSLTPVEGSDAVRASYSTYIDKLAAFVQASASKQDTDSLKSDLEASHRQLAEAVASAIR